MKKIITITTDFGMQDSYAAAVKGVISSLSPHAVLIDLSHDLKPWNIKQAAFFLSGCAPLFPKGTIHLIIVDPGVGTERYPVAAVLGNHTYVCPDNCILTLILERYPLRKVHKIENSHIITKNPSLTFQGRDIFAPAAAFLAEGGRIEKLGKKLDALATFDIEKIKSAGTNQWRGQIIHIDRFGNAITNFHIDDFKVCFKGNINLEIKNNCFTEIKKTYSAVPPASPLLLFGSSGYLEIALNSGSASEKYGIREGDEFIVGFG